MVNLKGEKKKGNSSYKLPAEKELSRKREAQNFKATDQPNFEICLSSQIRPYTLQMAEDAGSCFNSAELNRWGV